jgi:hypothetical protein
MSLISDTLFPLTVATAVGEQAAYNSVYFNSPASNQPDTMFAETIYHRLLHLVVGSIYQQ